ncbi:FAD dependent oxidoreductase [Faunimonas pinastri]|uniref:FAD dependent oxidoreductase n=1 Tax=Faunimonas pinastri TaxID=1855383 RepID=A0A1H9EEN7_9HYPH|nr:FAD-dependent oxidoreductase [Faunimonas pinastri]SEQ24042.1 FAD dependent oxidoreductase [Faunimonas pinastri]
MTATVNPITVDVVVVGAGSAGVAAAAAAAEEGATTVLLEASGHVGGTLAWQLLEHSAGFHDVHGNQVIAGFGDRLIGRLKELGSSPGHILDDVGYTATRTPVNHVELSLMEAVMLGEAGVQLWLNSPVVAVQREGDRITGLTVETPAGRRELRPGQVVDASGDAVVARRAGARFHEDAARTHQPASLTFKLGGVDFAALLDYARANPADFRPGNIIGDAADSDVNLWGLGSLLARGYQDGQLSLQRSEMHLAGWPRRGEAVVNVSRVSAGDVEENWTGDAAIQLSRQVLEFVRWFRHAVPGCAECYVAAVADRVGVRESGRVVGVATLTRDDLLHPVSRPDSIARGAFPIDIHEPDKPSLSHTEQLTEPYDIPYGCLVVDGIDNLLVAGRCISSTHEANGSARITATCFATGEAAGVAAALAASGNSAAPAVDVALLRQTLVRRGVLLSTQVKRPIHFAPVDC